MENDNHVYIGKLKNTYQNLRREYEGWQYAKYKPVGIENCIDKIICAMHEVEDLIENIENNRYKQ